MVYCTSTEDDILLRKFKTLAYTHLMTNFKPIRTPNAIDQAVFVLRLSRNIGQEYLDRIRSLKNVLDDEFETADDIKVMGLQFGPKGMQNLDDKISGVEFRSKIQKQAHLLVEDRPDWVLKISDDNIQISCLNYIDWDTTNKHTKNLITLIFEHLQLDSTTISELTLQINDTFIFDDDITNLNFNNLFVHNKYLAENVWNKGHLWHLNSGWFDSAADSDRVLNVLNISTRIENTEPSNKHITLIEHLQQHRFGVAKTVSGNEELPSQIFAQLHENNKLLICELLTEDIKKGIGL